MSEEQALAPSNLPPDMRLDPLVEQVLAHRGIWWVVRDDGLRTAWNGDDPVICPVCRARREVMPTCDHCRGRGVVDHIPFAERPWDEVIPNLWLGGHDCQPSSSRPEGECHLTGTNFDVVVSLYQRSDWDFALGKKVPDPKYLPPEGVEHHQHRMADAELEAEHHTRIDELADIVTQAIRDDKKVLVRCQAGLNRSGLVTALALFNLGHSMDQAITKMRQVRSPYVLCNESFVDYLKEKEFHHS